jgi:hypothetical protein
MDVFRTVWRRANLEPVRATTRTRASSLQKLSSIAGTSLEILRLTETIVVSYGRYAAILNKGNAQQYVRESIHHPPATHLYFGDICIVNQYQEA